MGSGARAGGRPSIRFRTLRCRLKPITPTDRRDLQVQGRMTRMPAIVHHVIGRTVRLTNLHELGIRVMIFTEMGAETALTVID
jgi:hypothetical protein